MPPRIIRTTATAFTGCSTTRSKAATSAPAKSNVYRLAQISVNIIDQCVAQGVPFAREYGGTSGQSLLRRRAGVTHVLCARPDGPAAAARRLPGAERQIGHGQSADVPADRNARPDRRSTARRAASSRATWSRARSNRTLADAVVLGTGGYGNVFYLSTNAKGSNCTAIWRAYKRGAAFANPCFTQIHPTCIPVSGEYQSKLTLMSESLRNDGRVWVPKKKGDTRPPESDSGRRARLLPGAQSIPASATWCRATSLRAMPKRSATKAAASAKAGWAFTSISRDAIKRLGQARHPASATAICSTCTSASPAKIRTTVPMRIYPAIHYTMGGLWVDYNLMTTIPGLFVIGEANFSDHGANRLGASALMQGLADGYFVLPYTIGDYLASHQAREGRRHARRRSRSRSAVSNRLTKRLLAIKGKRTVDSFHRELGKMMWDYCGMARNEAGLKTALQANSRAARGVLARTSTCSGSGEELNQSLENAGRVADFFEFAELMCLDALQRNESCGGHFREEYQTPDGEALRDDDDVLLRRRLGIAGRGQAARSCTKSR